MTSSTRRSAASANIAACAWPPNMPVFAPVAGRRARYRDGGSRGRPAAPRAAGGRRSRSRHFAHRRLVLDDGHHVERVYGQATLSNSARYDCDINDVVLAVVTGALGNWLMSRGETVRSSATIRAMAPLSAYADGQHDSTGPGQMMGQVTPLLVDLPVGEGNAVVRLATAQSDPGDRCDVLSRHAVFRNQRRPRRDERCRSAAGVVGSK